MRGERAAQAADLVAHVDEPTEDFRAAVDVARHGVHLDLLQHDLDVLERLEVALEDPLEEVRKEL
jgi:hypothetical protein